MKNIISTLLLLGLIALVSCSRSRVPTDVQVIVMDMNNKPLSGRKITHERDRNCTIPATATQTTDANGKANFSIIWGGDCYWLLSVNEEVDFQAVNIVANPGFYPDEKGQSATIIDKIRMDSVKKMPIRIKNNNSEVKEINLKTYANGLNLAEKSYSNFTKSVSTYPIYRLFDNIYIKVANKIDTVVQMTMYQRASFNIDTRIFPNNSNNALPKLEIKENDKRDTLLLVF